MLFEVKAPDGRLLRIPSESLEKLKTTLVAAYEVQGRVIGASADGKGGLVERIGGPTLMGVLLEAHGHELLDWLQKRLGA